MNRRIWIDRWDCLCVYVCVCVCGSDAFKLKCETFSRTCIMYWLYFLLFRDLRRPWSTKKKNLTGTYCICKLNCQKKIRKQMKGKKNRQSCKNNSIFPSLRRPVSWKACFIWRFRIKKESTFEARWNAFWFSKEVWWQHSLPLLLPTKIF